MADNPGDIAGGIVDAHHHLWKLDEVTYPWVSAKGIKRFFGDPTPIQKNYIPTDFSTDWSGIPITQSVHVQVGVAKGEEADETHSLSRMNSVQGFPSAIIAFCDLTSENREAELDRQLAYPLVRGIRQIIGRHPDEDSANGSPLLLQNSEFLVGLQSLAHRGLSFDLQLTSALLPAATDLLSHVPELNLILCHIGSPWDQSAEGLRQWRTDLEWFAARLPNASVKLSGISMFNPRWTGDEFRRVFLPVLEIFGPERCMWGSNFPVDKLHRGYTEIFRASWNATPVADRSAIFAETARRVYRL